MSQAKYHPVGKFLMPGFVAGRVVGEAAGSASSSVSQWGHHRFGGESWRAAGPRAELGEPVLLAVVDFEDPRWGGGAPEPGRREWPLFSYVNYEGLLAEQVYEVDWEEKRAIFTSVVGEAAPANAADGLAVPFPECPLTLREMTAAEIPTGEDSYWSACETFLGGDAFFRVGGAPVFADAVPRVGEEFRYVAAIGYEAYDRPGGYLAPPDDPFFLGELALYFFADWTAGRVKVITQVA